MMSEHIRLLREFASRIMTNKKEPATEMHVRLYFVSFSDELHHGLGIRDIASC